MAGEPTPTQATQQTVQSPEEMQKKIDGLMGEVSNLRAERQRLKKAEETLQGVQHEWENLHLNKDINALSKVTNLSVDDIVQMVQASGKTKKEQVAEFGDEVEIPPEMNKAIKQIKSQYDAELKSIKDDLKAARLETQKTQQTFNDAQYRELIQRTIEKEFPDYTKPEQQRKITKDLIMATHPSLGRMSIEDGVKTVKEELGLFVDDAKKKQIVNAKEIAEKSKGSQPTKEPDISVGGWDRKKVPTKAQLEEAREQLRGGIKLSLERVSKRAETG